MRKQNLWKSFTALAVTGTMLLCMTGCGSGKSADSSTAAGKDSMKEENSSQREGSKDLSWFRPGELPLVEEGTEKTLTVYMKLRNESPDPDEVWMNALIEQGMNINLEITKFTEENADEVLSLAFAGNELPDMIIGGEFSAGDLLKYGASEGQLLDLAPYINETYMPNLSSLYAKDSSYKEPVTDTEGHVWSLGFITYPASNQQVYRAFLNYDWLEECNLKVPETLDEFTDALRAFKAKGDNMIPMGGSYAWYNPMMYILNAFGYVTNDPEGLDVALRNGKVVLPVADREAYGEYLKYMNMLYTEGMIHPDFFTMDASTTDAVMSEGRNGFYCQAPFVFLDTFTEWWGAMPLTSEYNKIQRWPVNDKAVSIGNVVLTNACEEPELALAMIDWFYNLTDDVQDAHYLMSTIGANAEHYPELLFGYEGWQFGADGSQEMIAMVNEPGRYNSKKDYTIKQIQLWENHTLGCQLNTALDETYEAVRPGVADIMSKHDIASEARKDFTSGQYHFETALTETVCKVADEDVFPSAVYFDNDTQMKLNNLLVVISDYAENETAKFITGARSLDELDDYFDEIERLGAAEYVQTYAEYYEKIK